MARFQRGSLRKEARAAGQTWVYRYYCTRDSDGKRVERTLTIGLVRKFPSESSAWAEVNRLDLHTKINKAGFKSPKVTFGMLAQEFTQRELADDQRHLLKPRSHTTVASGVSAGQKSTKQASKVQRSRSECWLRSSRRGSIPN